MDIQKYLEEASKKWRDERAQTQMTLGELIATLKNMELDQMIDGFSYPHSYRGYYEDLAFEPSDEKITVGEALNICQEALNNTYCGWKGGDYMMGKTTPIWFAEHGCSGGNKIIELTKNGEFITQPDDY